MTATTSSARFARATVDKISARVFCQWQGTGGNPVTVFVTDNGLLASTQKKLAQTCDWESVVVDRRRRALAFYMPTGEQVSFCAHAAMGGALQLGAADKQETVRFVDSNEKTYQATIDEEDEVVSLHMTAPWTEERVSHPPTLQRLLRDSLGLQPTDLVARNKLLPTFCNASVARPKTLVYLKSLEALQNATPPPTGSDHFRVSCDAIDDTTGIFLYAERPDDSTSSVSSWECRQFPRASGYPEDPATGIAAAALAASLEHRLRSRAVSRGINEDDKQRHYKFYQGTAMGQASLIMVDNLLFNKTIGTDNGDEKDGVSSTGAEEVSFRLVGHVQVDNRESIEVEDVDEM
jgi:trans-2,3-dihydro-3-hydroxyanthranilate isomerase